MRARRLDLLLERARCADREAELTLAAWDAGVATSSEVEIAEARAARAWADYRCLAGAMAGELERSA